ARRRTDDRRQQQIVTQMLRRAIGGDRIVAGYERDRPRPAVGTARQPERNLIEFADRQIRTLTKWLADRGVAPLNTAHESYHHGAVGAVVAFDFLAILGDRVGALPVPPANRRLASGFVETLTVGLAFLGRLFADVIPANHAREVGAERGAIRVCVTLRRFAIG